MPIWANQACLNASSEAPAEGSVGAGNRRYCWENIGGWAIGQKRHWNS